jgi:lysyl-tRNA synthetase class 2
MTTLMQPVGFDSSVLSSASYDEGARELRVNFRDAASYTYSGISPRLFHALLSAPSKGAFFNRNIRGQFAYVKSTVEN